MVETTRICLRAVIPSVSFVFVLLFFFLAVFAMFLISSAAKREMLAINTILVYMKPSSMNSVRYNYASSSKQQMEEK